MGAYDLYIVRATIRQSALSLSLMFLRSRVPARKLPLLVAYALTIVKLADHGWISRESLGKGGGSIVGVLSMGQHALYSANVTVANVLYLYLVSGLLLSYRFSSAIGKWDEGKQVWSEVRTTIRDGIRMVSFAVFCSDVVTKDNIAALYAP